MEDWSEEDKREMIELLRVMGEAAKEAISMPEEQLSEEGSAGEKQLLEEQVLEEQQLLEAGPVAGLKRTHPSARQQSAPHSMCRARSKSTEERRKWRKQSLKQKDSRARQRM
ncbi:hypothetical protein LTR97_008803 [Elasticomyces elasticus]|uniref:Uncharacterized protein n=1 Tax=Elasticomyces elasticus TaxID=574655 RepID=A0AAN7ZZY9_9PEZI|nr:hypothetical protein LTR97_008803 [Elasticomyces elasticus]